MWKITETEIRIIEKVVLLLLVVGFVITIFAV
jgi:hypothetical protein